MQNNSYSSDKDRFVVHHNKSRYEVLLVLSIIMCLIITGVGIWILPSMIKANEIVGLVLIFGMAVFLGPVCGTFYIKALKEEYFMLIDSQGITTKLTGLIPWEDIEDVITYKSDSDLLGIQIRNEEKYLYRKKSLALAIHKMNKKLTRAMFQISLRYAEESTDEAIVQIEKRWNQRTGESISAYKKLCGLDSDSANVNSLKQMICYIDPTENEDPVKTFTIKKEKVEIIKEEVRKRIDTDTQLSADEAEELKESADEIDDYGEAYITGNGYLVVCMVGEHATKWVFNLRGVTGIEKISDTEFNLALRSHTDEMIFDKDESFGMYGLIDNSRFYLYDAFEPSLYEAIAAYCNENELGS